MEHNQDFTINDIGVKCRSKREVYTVLSSEGGIFLPPISDATQKYLRAIMLGDKDHVKCSEVKVIRVPHLEGLRTSCYGPEKRWILIVTFQTMNIRKNQIVNDLWTLWIHYWRRTLESSSIASGEPVSKRSSRTRTWGSV